MWATLCECALARVPSSTKACSVTAFCCITFRLISLSLSLLTSLHTIITLSLPSSFSHTWGGAQYGWNTNKLFSLKPLKTQLSSLASDTFRCCPRRMDISLFIRGTWVTLLGHPHLVLNISRLLCHSKGFQMRSFCWRSKPLRSLSFWKVEEEICVSEVVGSSSCLTVFDLWRFKYVNVFRF